MTTPTGYQRVTTATDYDVSAYQIHLRFDGVDDGLVTNTIDFTGTDKMTAAAGVRKLSDAAPGALVEFGINVLATNGSFAFFAPSAARPDYGYVSRGTALGNAASISGQPSPITNVLTGIGGISGDSAILRINGTLAASSIADQGTGNYGNYPLYIGRKAGVSYPFNGNLYSLIIRGAASSASQITSVERYINGKTKAYA